MTDETRLQRAVTGSAAVATIERARLGLQSALAQSRISAWVRQRRDMWLATPWPLQRVLSGVVLLVAAVVHVVLVLAAGDPAGSFWLIMPALAACAGALGILMGRQRSANR
jgi:hypothetical protein